MVTWGDLLLHQEVHPLRDTAERKDITLVISDFEGFRVCVVYSTSRRTGWDFPAESDVIWERA